MQGRSTIAVSSSGTWLHLCMRNEGGKGLDYSQVNVWNGLDRMGDYSTGTRQAANVTLWRTEKCD